MDDVAQQDQVGAYFRDPMLRAWLAIPFATIFVAATVLMLLSLATDDGPPVWFVLTWTAAVCSWLYWYAWRQASELEVSGERFCWTHLAHGGGQVSLTSIRQIQPARGLGRNLRFDTVEGSVYATAQPGLKAIVDAIATIRPDLPIRVPRHWRWLYSYR